MSVVLVTGGSRGLGKNMSLAIARRGMDVLLTYHSKEEEARSVVEEIQRMGRTAATLQLDTGDHASFPDFFERTRATLSDSFGTDGIDYLVNNAGIGVYAPFGDTSPEDFDRLVDIHFKGPYFFTQRALPLMNGGGGIINISSGLARFALPGYSAYGAVKGAMEVLTRYQAKELGERGIRANTVAPGAIETDFSGGAVRDNEELNKQIASSIALGRVGVPDDIGGVVAFLCTEDARWINGQRLEVSGGQEL